MKTRIHSLFFVAIALSVFTAPTQAGVLYWDGTSSTANADGGNGTWDTVVTNLNWDSLATAGVDTAWPSSGTDNDASFGGTTGTVTLDAGGVTANDLSFTTAGYILQGGKITLNGTTPTITNAVTATINSEIAGTVGLTKAGAGNLTLGAANTYTGTTTIGAGTLTLGSGASFASASALAFSGTSTLDLGGSSQTLSNISLAAGGTFTGTVSNGSLSLTSSGNVVLAPTGVGAANATLDLSGLTSFTVSKSSNNLTIGGNATSTTAQTGTLKLSATSNSITVVNLQVGPNGGTGSIVNTGSLQLGASNTINATNFQVGSTRSIASVVFQSGLLTPTVTLRALTGGSDRMATFLVGVNGAGGTAGNTQHADFSLGAIDARISTLTVSQGQSVGTTGTPPTVLGTFSMGTGTLDATSITISDNIAGGFNQTNTGTFNQQAGTVTVGTLTLGKKIGTTGTAAAPRLLPTYNLGTSTTSGTLFASSITAGSGTVATTTARTLNINNGTIRNLNSTTDLTINGTGAAGTGNNIVITLATGGTATFEADASRSITLGANTGMSGAGSLTKTGAGILNLNAANTYTGETRPQAGSIVLGAAGALGTSVLNMVAADTGTINFGTSTALTLGGIKGDRNISIANNSSASQSLLIGNASNHSYSGTLSGVTTAIAKVGAGTQTFTGASNSWSVASFQTRAGTFELNGGTMAVTGSATTTYAVGQNGFTVVGGSTFRLNGGTVNVSGSSFVFTAGHTTGGTGNFILDSGTFNAGNIEVLNAYGAAGTTTINGGTFIAGAFRVSQNTGILNLNGGTLRINNFTNNSTGTINFNGGTVEAKQDNSGFLPTAITNARIRAGGAVFNTSTFNVTVAKDLTEDATSTGGGLTKQGSGALVLSGANSYTGDTTVTAGTLLVNNTTGSGTGSGAVNVTGTALGSIVATLGGTGTISGATTIGALGKLSPTAQASGSKLSLSSTLAFDSGGTSIFNWDLSAANTPDPGDVPNNGAYGQVAVAGAVTNTAIFNISLLGGTGKTTSYADAFWDTNKTWNNLFASAGMTDLSTLFTSFTGTGLTPSGSGATAIATATDRGHFSFNGSTTLTWTAVPEPTSALAGILLGFGLLRRRR